MEALAALLSFISSSLIVYFLTPLLIRRHYALGIVGKDVHKPEGPLIPEMGGLAIVASVSLSSILAALIAPALSTYLLAFVTSFNLAAMIGIYDDLRGLKAKVKTFLTILCIVPIVMIATLSPQALQLGRPELPLIGSLRITILYWILLPFAIGIPANAVNMMDTYNGVMPSTCLLAALALLISGLVLGRWEAACLSTPLIGALAAYYPYNKYPSRIFSGDTGSLAAGAGIGTIAILSRLEIVGIVALMPHIMNAFHSLTSIRGLLEKSEIVERPVRVVGDVIETNPNPKAPLTLASLILTEGPLSEKDLVKHYVALSALSSLLAVVTALLMKVRI